MALTISTFFPEAYAADCETEPGNRNKLGTITAARVERDGTVFAIIDEELAGEDHTCVEFSAD